MTRAFLFLTLAATACTVGPGNDHSDAHPLSGAWSGNHLEFLADGETMDLPHVIQHPTEASISKVWTFDLAVDDMGGVTLSEALTTWDDDAVQEQESCVVEGTLVEDDDGGWSAHLPGPADPDAVLPCLTLDASCTLDAPDALTCTFTTPDEGTYAGLDASRYEQILTFEAVAGSDTGAR